MLGVLVLALASVPAHAQPVQDELHGLQPIEQTIGDVDPLFVSQRILPIDLRLPSAFGRVYRVPGSRSTLGGSAETPPSVLGPGELLMRVDGAVTAVFPRSVYVASGGSPQAVIPPSTVFYIGPLPESFPGSATETGVASEPTPAGLRIDLSAQMLRRPQRAALPLPGPVSIWTNEVYRRARLGHLLRLASATGRNRSAGP